MIEIKEFNPHDIEGFRTLAPDIQEGVFQTEPGVAYTIIANGIPLASCGIRKLWKGVGEAWAILSSSFQGKPEAFRRVRDLLEYAEIRGEYSRIHCFVPESFHEGRSFVRHLGFRCETYLYEFFPDGVDGIVYVRRASWLHP